MKTGYCDKLENGLSVCVDWIAFTIDKISNIESIVNMLGYPVNDFVALPSGANGYKKQILSSSGGLRVMYDGNEGMGVHVVVPGSAVDDVLLRFCNRNLIDTPFNSKGYVTNDFNSTVLADFLVMVRNYGHLTRLDLSIDDYGANYFTVPEVHELLKNDCCSAKFKNFSVYIGSTIDEPTYSGYTLYLGSRKSSCMLRIYDKQLEQNSKVKDAMKSVINDKWVRWELELKDERANSASEAIINGAELGDVVVGILGNYMRLIVKDNTRKTRCSNLPKWELFLAGIAPLKLCQKSKPKTIEDLYTWIERQVLPSLATLVEAYGGDLCIINELLQNGRKRMSNKHMRMIETFQRTYWE